MGNATGVAARVLRCLPRRRVRWHDGVVPLPRRLERRRLQPAHAGGSPGGCMRWGGGRAPRFPGWLASTLLPAGTARHPCLPRELPCAMAPVSQPNAYNQPPPPPPPVCPAPRLQRPCSQAWRTAGFEPYQEPTDPGKWGLTLACADYCDQDIGGRAAPGALAFGCVASWCGGASLRLVAAAWLAASSAHAGWRLPQTPAGCVARVPSRPHPALAWAPVLPRHLQPTATAMKPSPTAASQQTPGTGQARRPSAPAAPLPTTAAATR